MMTAKEKSPFIRHLRGLLALVCCMAVIGCLFPANAFASETTLKEGTDGNITWKAVYDTDAVYDSSRPDIEGMRILFLSG